MSDAATQGVIRDLFVVSMLALLLALPFYAFLRRRPDTIWNYEGNVLARPYNWMDGLAALLLLTMFFFPLFADQPPHPAARQAGQELPISLVLVNTIMMLMIAMLVVVYFRVARGLDPVELFGMRQMPVRKAFGVAFGAVVLTYIAMIFGKWFVESVLYQGNFPDNSSQETVQTFEKSNGGTFRLVMTLAAVVIAPVAEETLFRGFFYGVVKRLTDRWFATIFVSLLFALVHHHVGSLVPLFVLALGLTTAYEATGCLLVPVFMHAIFNGLNILELIFKPLS
jgi:membrane protease YdiL (CAAX protease family)